MALLNLTQPVRIGSGVLVAFYLVVASASAQDVSSRTSDVAPASNQFEAWRALGRTAETGVGEVGERQEREDIVPNAKPMERINNRLQNRVQNRLSSRIGSNNRLDSDTSSAFERAGMRVRNVTMLNDDETSIDTSNEPSQ